jgi:phospholipid/cholesterol/gamma-HCH transport system ATP-binding protein
MATNPTYNIKESGQTAISIRGLHKSFGDLQVLCGVDLDVFKGENVVVLGRSGTGKSVLITILVGLLKPDAGTVNVRGSEGESLSRRELDALRLKIGFSFQNSALYDSMSVRQNLAFPLKMNFKHLKEKEVDQAVEEALSAVGLLDKLERADQQRAKPLQNQLHHHYPRSYLRQSHGQPGSHAARRQIPQNWKL